MKGRTVDMKQLFYLVVDCALFLLPFVVLLVLCAGYLLSVLAV